MSASPTKQAKSLTRTSEYRRVYAKGKLLKGSILWAYILPTAEGNQRAGIAISSRIIKGATQRNRLKRIIKEWLRLNLVDIFNKGVFAGGFDIVIVVKRHVQATRTASKIVREELSRLISPIKRK